MGTLAGCIEWKSSFKGHKPTDNFCSDSHPSGVINPGTCNARSAPLQQIPAPPRNIPASYSAQLLISLVFILQPTAQSGFHIMKEMLRGELEMLLILKHYGHILGYGKVLME